MSTQDGRLMCENVIKSCSIIISEMIRISKYLIICIGYSRFDAIRAIRIAIALLV